MDIKELNERLEKVSKALAEMEHMSDDDFNKAYDQVEKENLEHERKSTFKVYNKAIEALEQLKDIIADSRDPFTDKLDPDTDGFYDKLVDITNEIYSRSLAFEESLDESEILEVSNAREWEYNGHKFKEIVVDTKDVEVIPGLTIKFNKVELGEDDVYTRTTWELDRSVDTIAANQAITKHIIDQLGVDNYRMGGWSGAIPLIINIEED